ncbi:MAG: Fpg/Nei family DNA glycosylase [Acidimicrobiales bacterium]|nr:Fpg/Nei family DNA glycosylase [Acidimicrobiales bacterium]
MRELPEVEVLRRDLERECAGKKIKTVEAKSMALLGNYKNRKSFTSQLDGVKVNSVTRHGKLLQFHLDNDHIMAVTVGATTNLVRASNRAAEIPNTEIVITFTQHGGLRIIDGEGSGDVQIVPAEEFADAYPALANLGIDPIAAPVSWTTFGEMLIKNKGKLKNLLTDETFIAGIGSMYADEILFTAGLRYDRVSTTLSTQEIRRLYRALVETLHDAIKYRGTSLEDDSYVDAHGESGEYQTHLSVYGKDGELSPRSRTPILRSKFGGEWTYYCDTQV